MKKLILFLFLSILSTSLMAVTAQNVLENPNEENPLVQENGEACSQLDETPNQEKPCCNGLVIGSGARCVEMTIVDPELSACTNNSQCQNGTACMPLSQKHLFSKVSPSWNKPEYADLQAAIEIQTADAEDLKSLGGSCSHPNQCASYSCSPLGICVEKKVCRYADLNESPIPGQKCATTLVLKNGVCKPDPASQYPVYNSLLDDINFSQAAGQCSQFTMDSVTELESKKAMKHMRAFEWMFMTHTVDPYNDCFNFTAAIKDDIMKKYQEDRKAATEVFAKNMLEVEKDILTLKNAKTSGEAMVTIHDGTEILSGTELDMRMASGNDALKIMMRRNGIFIEYQLKMAEIHKDTTEKFKSMHEKMQTWNNGDSSWNLGVRQTGNKDCSAKYRKFVWSLNGGWKTRMYNSTESRRGLTYSVGTREGAMVGFGFDLRITKPALDAAKNEVLFKEGIASTLTDILGLESVEKFKTQYSKPFYLIDPVMHGGTLFNSFGTNFSSGGATFLGIGGKVDLRPLRHSPNLKSILNGRKEKLKEYYRNFRSNSSVTQGIYYEPELVPTLAKDCLSSNVAPGSEVEEAARVAACQKFDKYLDEILDISMAQFLAYSIRHSLNYSDYFNSAPEGRMRLITHSQVMSVNLGSYYTASAEMLNKQNECLDKVVRGLHDSGIISAGGEGVQEGSYYDPTIVPGTIGIGNQGPKNIKPIKGTISAGTIGTGLASNFNSGSNVNLGPNSSGTKPSKAFGSGSTDNSLGAFFATKKKELIAKNEKAKSMGVKVVDKAKSYAETVDSMNKGSSGASKGKGSASASNSSTSGLSNNSSSSNDSKDANSGNGVDEMAGSAGATSGGPGMFPLGGGNGSGYANSGVSSGSSSGDSNDSVSELTDQTGMSDEEKSRMMAIYDRNKHKYTSDGDDGIFEKVSKAYVRNLEKILIRKKTID